MININDIAPYHGVFCKTEKEWDRILQLFNSREDVLIPNVEDAKAELPTPLDISFPGKDVGAVMWIAKGWDDVLFLRMDVRMNPLFDTVDAYIMSEDII